MGIGGVEEFRHAVDAFMAQPKTLIGAEEPRWGTGRNRFEKKLKFPLEVDGEQLGRYLFITYYPDDPGLHFHIGIQFLEYVVCRLDFDVEDAHANNIVPYRGVVPDRKSVV